MPSAIFIYLSAPPTSSSRLPTRPCGAPLTQWAHFPVADAHDHLPKPRSPALHSRVPAIRPPTSLRYVREWACRHVLKVQTPKGTGLGVSSPEPQMCQWPLASFRPQLSAPQFYWPVLRVLHKPCAESSGRGTHTEVSHKRVIMERHGVKEQAWEDRGSSGPVGTIPAGPGWWIDLAPLRFIL